MLSRIDPIALDLPLAGLRLQGGTLRAELADESGRPTLLAFLRHFGCLFCREMVRDLRSVSEKTADYPRIVFVGQGDPQESEAFLNSYWPGASIICDPDRVLYRAFGLGKGSIYQMFGPSVWGCGIRATVKGNFIGRPIGDPWTMPGAFVVDASGAIRWQHDFSNAGDHPDWKRIPAMLNALPATPPSAPLATAEIPAR